MSYDHDKPMWDDPAESSRLRQLLRAGRNASNSRDYDVEQGLARHLATVQSGASLPDWAEGMHLASGGGGLSLTWLIVPLMAAASFGGVWFVSDRLIEPTPRIGQVAPPANPAEAPADAPADTKDVGGAVEPQAEPAIGPIPASVDADSALARAADSREAGRSVLREPAPADRNVPGRRYRGHAVSDDTRAQHGDGSHAARLSNARGASSAPAANGTALDSTELAADAAEARARANVPAPREAQTEREPQPALAQTQQTQPQPAQPIQAQQPSAPAQPQRVQRGTDSRLEREMQMLAVAQRVLHDDPARTLRLARQGEREFAGSMFSAERKQVGLLALVQLGRLEEARKLGRPFLATYPNAPWSERLRQALATGRIPLR